MTRLRRGSAALLWLVAVLVIALGAAGLVTGMDGSAGSSGAAGSAGSAGRFDLTARGDAIVTASLDAAEADLQHLADDVAELGTSSRGALAALNGSDLATVDAAVAEGDELVASIRERTAAIRAELAATPLVGEPDVDLHVSRAVQDRHQRLVDALGATTDLDGAWARLTVGSLAASRLSARLSDHDEAVLKAASQGRDAKYKDAVKTLDDADAALAEARTLRNKLAATVDVTVLDQWIERNAEYDKALRGLYEALQGVGGKVTSKVREAIDAERAAKDRLPPDSRGLIVIMSEIGRGGMNSAVITIEEARGRLADALAAAGPSGGPSAVP